MNNVNTSVDYSRAFSEPAPEIAARRFTLRDLLVQLFYHATLLRVCLLLGIGIGIAAAALSTTYFTANTLMLVLIGPESAAAQDGSGGGGVVSVDGLKVVQSEIQIIQSDTVLRPTVEQIGPATIYPALARPRLFGLLPAYPAQDQTGVALQKLHTDLRVEAEPGSNVIRIGFTHPDRATAIKVVQFVLDGYLAQRRAIYASTNSTFLDKEINRYSEHLKKLNEQIQALRARYDVLDMAQDIVLATNRLDGIVQRQNQVKERRVAVQTEIVAVKANLASQPETVLSFREQTNNTGNDEARNTLVRLMQERTRLTAQYGANYPAARDIDQRIATVQQQINGAGKDVYSSERVIRNPALDLLNNRLASLEVEDQALGQQLIELAGQSRVADDRIKALGQADGQLHSLQMTRDVAEGIYRQLSARQPGAVFQDNVVDERNANMRVVQPPTAPSIGYSMTISYLVGGGFLGLLLGLAAVAVASLLQQVYLSPNDAERDLHLVVLGEIGEAMLRSESSKRELALVDPGIANLAGLLQDTTVGGRKLSSLQLVGASPADGRDSIIRALGTELAVGYDMQTLILDLQGDGRGHAQELAKGPPQIPSTDGAVSVVATDIPSLWVSVGATDTPLGDRRASAARIRQTLEALHHRFNMLLIITADDMASSAMRRLAGIVDANILVLRAEHTRAPVAERLREAILAVGGNMLGFVFIGRRYYVPRWLYRWI